MSIGALLRDLVPERGNARRYALMGLVSATGDGLFLSGTAVFALQVVGLRPQQVGFSLSAAGVAGFLAAGTTGALADRFGARRVMLLCCLLQAAGYLAYCVVHSFPAFTVLAALVSVFGFTRGTANAALVSAIATGERRVRLRAQGRSLFNLGFSAGSGLSALVMAVGTLPAYYLLPVGDAVSFLAATVLIVRLPDTPRLAAAGRRRSFAALRNPLFLLFTALHCVLTTHESLVVIVVPLWIVERTVAPHPVIGLLLIVNTLLCVLFQVRMSAGAESLHGSVRKARRAALLMLPCCLLLGLSGSAPAALAVVLVLAGYVLLTCWEMLETASSWGASYSIAPRHAQGQYLGAFAMSMAGQSVIGPAIGTWAVLDHGIAGWIGIAVVCGTAALALGPVTRWTARRVARDHATGAGPAPADVTTGGAERVA